MGLFSKKKKTDDLMQELISSGNFDKYCQENSDFLIRTSLTNHLEKMLKKKKLKKADVIRRTEFSEVYCYQIFSGRRNPSRDVLICICVAMGMNIDEVQKTLKIAGTGTLYPRKERDSIIILGITGGKSVAQINSELYDKRYPTLSQCR